MTRVIAGQAGGRRLAVPAGRDTRPTSDRAREGLFATIASMAGPLAGARVLDLYAGSGAVGLEALSRGAGHVLLVESGARASRVIRENITALGLPGAEVITDRVERVLARGPAGGRYDIVFADPPYAMPGEEVSRLLGRLTDRTWLAAGGIGDRGARHPVRACDLARRVHGRPGAPVRGSHLLVRPDPAGLTCELSLERGDIACIASSVRVPSTR